MRSVLALDQYQLVRAPGGQVDLPGLDESAGRVREERREVELVLEPRWARVLLVQPVQLQQGLADSPSPPAGWPW